MTEYLRDTNEWKSYWKNEWNKGHRILPARGGNPNIGRKIDCSILKKIGKVGFRELCKSEATYKLSIKLDNANIFGKSDNGNIIPINSIGRWLFGVPGYGGNAIFYEDHGAVYVPCETPEIVDEMIKRKCGEYAVVMEDTKWPMSIRQKGKRNFEIIEDWSEEVNHIGFPIDYPQKLCELPQESISRLEFIEKLCKQMPELNDRVLFLQAFHYSEKDFRRLHIFCIENSLKHIGIEISPDWRGVLIYEDYDSVEEKVNQLLNNNDYIYRDEIPEFLGKRDESKENVILTNEEKKMSDYVQNLLKQLEDEGRDERTLHAYLMGVLDGRYYDEKKFTNEEYEAGKKLVAMIPPTPWEKANPEGMDYDFYSK